MISPISNPQESIVSNTQDIESTNDVGPSGTPKVEIKSNSRVNVENSITLQENIQKNLDQKLNGGLATGKMDSAFQSSKMAGTDVPRSPNVQDSGSSIISNCEAIENAPQISNDYDKLIQQIRINPNNFKTSGLAWHFIEWLKNLFNFSGPSYNEVQFKNSMHDFVSTISEDDHKLLSKTYKDSTILENLLPAFIEKSLKEVNPNMAKDNAKIEKYKNLAMDAIREEQNKWLPDYIDKSMKLDIPSEFINPNDDSISDLYKSVYTAIKNILTKKIKEDDYYPSTFNSDFLHDIRFLGGYIKGGNDVAYDLFCKIIKSIDTNYTEILVNQLVHDEDTNKNIHHWVQQDFLGMLYYSLCIKYKDNKEIFEKLNTINTIFNTHKMKDTQMANYISEQLAKLRNLQ